MDTGVRASGRPYTRVYGTRLRLLLAKEYGWLREIWDWMCTAIGDTDEELPDVGNDRRVYIHWLIDCHEPRK